MRVFLDENMPRPLWRLPPGHEVSFVEREGWKGQENGALLRLVAARFDVLLTSDGAIVHQNELAAHDLSLIVLPTNNLTILRANALSILRTLDELRIGERAIVIIDWKGRRTRRSLEEASSAFLQLSPVPPFAR